MLDDVELRPRERVVEHGLDEPGGGVAYVATVDFENGGLTSWRSRVWRGGSVSSMVLRAASASAASSSISVPPISDEYVRQSLCTATSSSQRVTDQKPAPV